MLQPKLLRRGVWSNSLFFLFLLWFASDAFLFAYYHGGLKPLDWFILFWGFAALCALGRVASGYRIFGSMDFWVGAFFIWLGLYTAYGAFEFLRSSQDAVAVQALITLGESVLTLAGLVFLMSDRVRLRITVKTMALVAVSGSIINWWDFFEPTFTKLPGRAAGLYIAPNIAGNVIAMAMAAGVGAVPRRLRIVYLLLCGTGIFVTFSREAWIIWGLAVFWLGWQGGVGSRRRRFAAVGVACIVGFGFTGLLFSGQLAPVVAHSSLKQYLDPHTAARLGIGASVLSGESATQHEDLIYDSLQEAASAPWLGHGLGFTSEWRYSLGPHDMYLLFLVEGGVIGAILYIGLMCLLWRAGVGASKVVALQVIVSGLFSHTHLVLPVILVMFAFVFAHGGLARLERCKWDGLPRPIVA